MGLIKKCLLLVFLMAILVGLLASSARVEKERTPPTPSSITPPAVSISPEALQNLWVDAACYFYADQYDIPVYILRIIYSHEENLALLDVIVSLVKEESRGDPKATNINRDSITKEIKSIDRGLFQLNDKSYPWLAPADFFDPNISARKGIAHLKAEIKRFDGNLRLGLIAYNAGWTRAYNPPERTVLYVDKILARAEDMGAARKTYTVRFAENYISKSLK